MTKQEIDDALSDIVNATPEHAAIQRDKLAAYFDGMDDDIRALKFQVETLVDSLARVARGDGPQ